MDPLAKLASFLSASSSSALERPWAVDVTIDAHIADLASHLRRGVDSNVPQDLQEEAVRRFWTSKQLPNLREARLVSFGIALPIGQQRVRLIEDRERFPILLSSVDEYLGAPKQYRRCYQGLVAGYFNYDPEAQQTPPIGRENWRTLRTYLGKRAGRVTDGLQNPQWTESLQRHGNLFDEDPCRLYGPALLAGQHTEVDELREVLDIPDSSWFMRKLFLAQIRAAVDKADHEFLALHTQMLALLAKNGIVRDEGLALLLNRHAQLRPPPLAVPLRDAAVNAWGNPWLHANAMRWGTVTADARSMVADWLKLEFIEAFFTLLAEEHTGDNRRLQFWAQYVSAIEDIHFALGADARENASHDFTALRKKMTGLMVPLQDNVRSNNAFIMRMGPLVVVEFSGYSNACYGYDATRALPFRFDRPLVLPKDATNSLKRTDHELWLAHHDGVRGFDKWEDRFAAELANKFRIKHKGEGGHRSASADTPWGHAPGYPDDRARPATSGSGLAPTPERAAGSSHEALRAWATGATPDPRRPAPPAHAGSGDRRQEMNGWKTTNYSRKALALFAERFGLTIEDLSPQGNLWVRTDDEDLGVSAVLLKWGFTFKNGKKGWWRSGQ